MTNPYKTQEDPKEVRKIIGDVGVEDWEHIERAIPGRGAQDVIIGTMFQAFINEVKRQNIPAHYEPENHSKVEAILRRFALA